MLVIDPRSHIFHYPNQLYAVETAEERSKLPVRKGPYWWSLGYGRQLGYSKRITSRSWLARIRLLNRTYKQCRLAETDDTKTSDGLYVLSFEQAADAATIWFGQFEAEAVRPTAPMHRAPDIPEPPESDTYTVAHAVRDYLHWYYESGKNIRAALYVARCFIIPELGDIPLAELQTRHINPWLHKITVMPARIRTARDQPQKFKPPPQSEEELRRRKDTANRTLAYLKAILNKAYCDGHIESDLAWKRVRKHWAVMSPRVRYLTKEQARRLVASADADLARLLKGALFTGCRFAELQRLTVGDYMPATQKLFIERTKRGMARSVALTDDGNRFFVRLTTGRTDGEPMLVRSDGRPWGRQQYNRQLEEACRRTGIDPPVNFHILRHTYASHAAMAGIPLIVIAKQLGHADTRMVERYYAHFAETFIDQQIRARMPTIAG